MFVDKLGEGGFVHFGGLVALRQVMERRCAKGGGAFAGLAMVVNVEVEEI